MYNMISNFSPFKGTKGSTRNQSTLYHEWSCKNGNMRYPDRYANMAQISLRIHLVCLASLLFAIYLVSDSRSFETQDGLSDRAAYSLIWSDILVTKFKLRHRHIIPVGSLISHNLYIETLFVLWFLSRTRKTTNNGGSIKYQTDMNKAQTLRF